MARLEGIRVRNFGVLKDVTLGRLWNQKKEDALTSMTAVIGKNGVGKSVLVDAFGFLADALKSDVETACDARGRGGFERIRSQGVTEPIQFDVYYREHGNARPITYHIAIEADKSGRPYVLQERLRQRRKGQSHGQPFSFLRLNKASGVAWKGERADDQIEKKIANLARQMAPVSIELAEFNEIDIQKDRPINQETANLARQVDLDLLAFLEFSESVESSETEVIKLEDPRRLGIATLGALKQHPRISAFRRFIEGWYLSYFTPDAARSLPLAGPQEHLNSHGDNLGNVVQFMEREYPQRFRAILKKIADRIPGIDRIETEKTSDGRLLLKFKDKGFQNPFYGQQVSDGTLKLFTYFLLLEDPTPPPFLCIEEPENGLYHKLLETLAYEFREHASGRKGSTQIFITTHQPYFVDALDPKEVWILEKGEDGFSTIRRASKDQGVNHLVEEGLPLGSLWYSGYLDPRQQNAL